MPALKLPLERQLPSFHEAITELMRIFGVRSFMLHDVLTNYVSPYRINPQLIVNGDILAVVQHYVDQG